MLKVVNIFTKACIIDIWQGPKYVSAVKVNPFMANILILYPLKTPENLWL